MKSVESALLRETCSITGHSGGHDSVPVRRCSCCWGRERSCCAAFVWTGIFPWRLLNLTPKQFVCGAVFWAYVIKVCESILSHRLLFLVRFFFNKGFLFFPFFFLRMSTTQRQVLMESSLALGRLELTPGSPAGGVSLTPRLCGGPPAKEKCGQRPQGPQGPQGQAHLNGCVPLSHQVAGHKYGVDKVGE